MARVTIYDVAEKAGVSIASVSRVLNSPEQVNEPLRARVLAVIDELGFVPKAEAAARARRTVQRIGVLAPFFTYPSFVQRLRGVAGVLVNSPYELVVYTVDSLARRDGYLASLPLHQRLDGLIVMSLAVDDRVVQRLLAHRLETVLIEYHHPALSSIEIDDRAGGCLAAQYALTQGHQRCAFLGDGDLPAYSLWPAEARLAGYRETLAAGGVELTPDAVRCVFPDAERARQAARQLLARPNPPTFVFCSSDVHAMGVLKAARETGIPVPRQLTVVGFDDLDVAAYVGLTTIRQPLDESGRLAADILLDRLADRTRPAQRVMLPLTLQVRET